MIHIFNKLKNLYTRDRYVVCIRKNYSCTVFKCKKCENSINQEGIVNFFCNKCSWPIEPRLLKDVNIFKLFNIEPEYNIDKNTLGQTYKQYQFMLHPDKHVDKNEVELEIMTSNSSIISTYYNTLLDDKQRAKYLFIMKYGNKMFEENINKTEEDQLERIMEAHEKVESILNEEENKQMKMEFKNKIEDAVNKIELGFKNDDPNSIINNYRNLSFYIQIYDKLTQ